MSLLADRRTNAIEGVDLDSVQVLVELVGEKSTLEKELLKRRFGERARSFEDTLSFMKGMQALNERGRKILRARNLNSMQKALIDGEQDFKRHLVKLIADSPSRYGCEMREFLNAFGLVKGKAWLKVADSGGVHYATRNVLISAEVIHLDHETGMYTINNWFHREFVEARYSLGTTPKALDKALKEDAKIGLAAELQVLEFERATVGYRDAEKVVHIALSNTNAGFDIASTRREKETDQLCIRMIEVKAVSPKKWAFTLTQNELRVAEENRDSYHLYLVPVFEGKPEVSEMLELSNPAKALLDSNKWTIREGDWDIRMVNRNG